MSCKNIGVFLAHDMLRGVYAPYVYQPHDIIDDTFDNETMSLLHRHTSDLTKEGNHFDILCLKPMAASTLQQQQQHNNPTTTTTTPTRTTTSTSHQHNQCDLLVLPFMEVEENDYAEHTEQAHDHAQTQAPDMIDMGVNTDAMVTCLHMNRTDVKFQSFSLIPSPILPVPCLHCGCYIPPTCHNLWLRVCGRYLHAAWLAHRKGELDKRDAEIVNFYLLPRQVLIRKPGQRSACHKLKKTLRHHQHQPHTQHVQQFTQHDHEPQQPRDRHKQDQTTRNVKRATQLVRQGHLRRAMMALTQTEPVIVTPDVITELRDLHPPQETPVYPLPTTAPYMTLSGNELDQYIREFDDEGAAPGPSGWTSDLIRPLVTDAQCQNGLAILLMLIINGEGTGQLKHMILSGRGLPTYKPNGNIRPLTMPEVFYKIAGKINLKRVDQAKIFPDIQYRDQS